MRVLAASVIAFVAGCLGSIDGLDRAPDPVVDAGTVPDAPTPESARKVLEQWSGCMTLDAFRAANMAQAWGTLAGTDARLCRNCHSGGAFGFIATRDEAEFFAAISQHASMMSMYLRADVPNKRLVVNVGSFQAADQSPGHPHFNPENNAGMTALRTFHAAIEANAPCGAPTLVD